ncbi:AAA family ATPase [Mesobacillus zeae]|uniref:YhaN AAA domain-containing protein n=1 Tax=Mesobacillus zeae TaxID=1917180 RepID=A0A398B9Q7_9BACI|nr:AAA family ATPase [Mesobacillus zeae]RID84630.1 hypothetical protein D1970_12125 [Mesobacillus zeae]
MKLIEIHIYGYGKLENIKLLGLQGIQVFYGENEAGKSTIMSFIHSILFGFPTKQQNDLRYEPKKHSKYGGMLKAEFPGKRLAVIERVKGKATGDVTVTLEDGTAGGEELLSQLLEGMDKSTYQSIFSFGFQGLQNVNSIKGEDLGRYLFSAGALGTDKLMQVENHLLKEMEQRFKPGGKKPVLNEMLKELKTLHESLKKAENESKEYILLTEERSSLEKRLTDIHEKQEAACSKLARLNEMKRLQAVILEGDRIRRNLMDEGNITFPENGINRLERILDLERPLATRREWLAEKVKKLEAEAEASKPDMSMLEREAEITARLETFTVYEQEKVKQREIDSRLEEIAAEIDQANDHFNKNFTEETISFANTSLFVKERAEEIQLSRANLLQRKVTLDESFQEESVAVQGLEAEVASLEQEVLGKEEREELYKQLKALESRDRLEEELRQITLMADSDRSRKAMNKKRAAQGRKRESVQSLVLGFLFLCMLAAGAVSSQWLLAVGGLGGLLLVLFMLFRPASVFDAGETGKELELNERERELKKLLNEASRQDSLLLREKVAEDEKLRSRLQDLKARLDQQNHRFDRVIQAFEKWESEIRELNKLQDGLARELQLETYPENGRIYDTFLLVERQKQLFREYKRLKERWKAVRASQEELENAFKELSSSFLKGEGVTLYDTASMLKKKLRSEIERAAGYKEAMTKLSELREEDERLKKEHDMLSEEKAQLLQQAGTEEEESFRLAGKMAGLQAEQSSRLQEITFQLEVAGISEQEKDQVLTGLNPDEAIADVESLANCLKAEHQKLHDRLAEVRHKIGMLEAGGLYSELLHQYRQLKSEFQEKAKEWSKFSIAKDLLLKTVERYKSSRMPRMLENAEEYLRFLTGGEYMRITPNALGSGFWIENKEHTRFEANELSQATAEQVYVSLRLALASTLYGRYPFPIIIDDSFVNFDRTRAKRMIQLIKTLPENQVLFFTCHSHLLEEFEDSEIIRLGGRKHDQSGERIRGRVGVTGI